MNVSNLLVVRSMEFVNKIHHLLVSVWTLVIGWEGIAIARDVELVSLEKIDVMYYSWVDIPGDCQTMH